MRSLMRGRLLWRLLAINVVLLIAALIAAWLAVDYLARDSFMALMKQFSIDPAEVEGMFLSSTRTAMVEVGAVAVLVACALSFWMTRRILRPLDRLADGATRIAAGDHGHRIDAQGLRDELGALIAEFNRMAESLEKAERARRGMVVDVAHELRTPLTNLRGTVEAMQDRLLPLGDSSLEALHEELLRLGRLTEDLLTAARLGSKTLNANREPSDLGELLERTHRAFLARLMRRRLEVRMDLDGVTQPVAVDRDQMLQVFGNLLQNALQFAPEGSQIQVRGQRQNGAVRIEFANGGEAIHEDDLAQIFDPYFRVDRSRSREAGGGAGLGLAIVRGLVEGHGGRVGANSDPDATRIWVELPA